MCNTEAYTAKLLVYPIVTCYTKSTAQFNVYFEYVNPAIIPFSIPFGSENLITQNGLATTALVSGQPTQFLVGKHIGFKDSDTNLKDGVVEWRVDGNEVFLDLLNTPNLASYLCPSVINVNLNLNVTCPATTSAIGTTMNNNLATLLNSVRTQLGVTNEGHTTSVSVVLGTQCGGTVPVVPATAQVSITNPAGAQSNLAASAMDLMWPLLQSGQISNITANTGTVIQPQPGGDLAAISESNLNPLDGTPDPALVPYSAPPDVIIGSLQVSTLTFLINFGSIIVALALIAAIGLVIWFGLRRKRRQEAKSDYV